MMRDTWRAVLVVVTAALLREVVLLPRPVVAPAATAVATNWHPQYSASAGWQQPWPAPVPAVATSWQAAPAGPIRKVARATVDLAESVIEAIR